MPHSVLEKPPQELTMKDGMITKAGGATRMEHHPSMLRTRPASTRDTGVLNFRVRGQSIHDLTIRADEVIAAYRRRTGHVGELTRFGARPTRYRRHCAIPCEWVADVEWVANVEV